jgi:hypothetical protein
MSETATDTAAPPAQAAAADPAPPPAASAPPDWRATLPAELRDAPNLAKFSDVGALAKGYVEAETLIGRKGVIVPTDKDAPEVHARYRAALGVPETPDGYAFKAPEGLPAEAWQDTGLKSLATWAHELGITPTQAQGLAERYARQQAEEMQRAAQGIGPDGKPMEEVLRGEWGAAYDAKVDLARRAARQFGGDAGALDALEAKIGGAALLKMFARIGETMADDRPAGMGTGQPARTDPAAELKQIMAPGSAYWQPLHPEHRQVFDRARELFALQAARAG